MFYFEDIPKRLVRTFNSLNHTALTVDQVKFINPRPVSSIKPKPATTCNTAITMQLLPGGPFTGETTLYYDRQDLQTKFKNAPLGTALPIQVERVAGVHDLLGELSKRLGAKFTADDFYNDPVTAKLGIAPVTIRAKPGSLLWTGALTVLVWRFDTSSELAFDYPGKLWTLSDATADAANKITGKYSVAHYSYSYDYSSQASVLAAIPAYPGDSATTRLNNLTMANGLQAALTAVDGVAWSVRTSVYAGLNIYQSWVLYNGPIDDWDRQFTLYPNFGGSTMADDLKELNQFFSPEFDRVLVMELNNPTYSTIGYPCYLIAHYNLI